MARVRVEMERLAAENRKLRDAIADLHWMARMYADGRSTYITGELNRITRTLLGLRVCLKPHDDGKLFARDAMGDGFAGLTALDAEIEQLYCADCERWREYGDGYGRAST